MGSAKKIGIISLSVALLAIVVLLLALPYLMDLEQIRRMTEEEATKAIGRQVTISRSELDLFPSPTVRLEDISVAAIQGEGNVSEMSASSMELGLAWSAILRAHFQVSTVTVVEPEITFLLNPEGALNLKEKGELIVGSLLSGIRYASEAAMAGDLPVQVSLALRDIKIKGGEIVLKDPYENILDKDLSIGNIDASFTYTSSEAPLKFTASIKLQDSQSSITAKGTAGPFGDVPEPGNIPLKISGRAENLHLKGTAIPLRDIPLVVSGTFQSQGTFFGTLNQGFEFRQEAEFEDVMVSSREGFAAVRDLAGSLVQEGRISLAENSIELASFDFTAGDARFSAAGSVSHTGVLPQVDMRFESSRIDLADFVKYFPDLEKRISVKGDLTIKGHAKGTVSKDLLATMDIVSSNIEMDRGPLLMEKNAVPDHAADEAQKLPQLLPPSLPMTVSARISVSGGRFEWVDFSDLTADIRVKNRWASLDRMDLSAFGGRLTGSSWFNMRKLPANYGNDIQIRDMEIDQFLEAFAGLKGMMYGKASLDLFVSGRGVNMDQFKETTLGLGKFNISSGKYTPANFLKGALEVASLPINNTQPDQTEFDSMESTIAVRGGNIDFTGLTCTAEDWVLDGSGIIGLDQSLSLRYLMTLSDSVVSTIGKDKQEYLPRDDQGHLQIPFKLSGTFTSPEFSLDSKAMEKVAVKKEP